MPYAGHRGQRSDDEDDEEEEGEVEQEEEPVKKGSDEEDSDGEAAQKEKKAESHQVVLRPVAAAQAYRSPPLTIVSVRWTTCRPPRGILC